MTKKTILVTGSTDGIGKLAAIKLAKDANHEILLHGRNPEKVAATVSEIKESAKNDNVKGYVSDFSDLKDIKRMTQQMKQEVSNIDVLINNAGVFKTSQMDNKDGLDLRITVNYLAAALLTKELMPLLMNDREAKDKRIINLASAGQASINPNVLRGKLKCSDQFQTYAQSKLAMILWSFSLSKQLQNTNSNTSISVIAVNPGSLLNTNMVREGFGSYRSSADKGADILYKLAVSKDHQGITGKYFDNDAGGYGQAHGDAYNDNKIAELMETTNAVLAGYN